MSDQWLQNLSPRDSINRFAEKHGFAPQHLPSTSTLAKLRCYGGGPPFSKPKPQTVLYYWPTFERWLLEKVNPRASTASVALARRKNLKAMEG
jgi:hypothetical protein